MVSKQSTFGPKPSNLYYNISLPGTEPFHNWYKTIPSLCKRTPLVLEQNHFMNVHIWCKTTSRAKTLYLWYKTISHLEQNLCKQAALDLVQNHFSFGTKPHLVKNNSIFGTKPFLDWYKTTSQLVRKHIWYTTIRFTVQNSFTFDNKTISFSVQNLFTSGTETSNYL